MLKCNYFLAPMVALTFIQFTNTVIVPPIVRLPKMGFMYVSNKPQRVKSEKVVKANPAPIIESKDIKPLYKPFLKLYSICLLYLNYKLVNTFMLCSSSAFLLNNRPTTSDDLSCIPLSST